MSDGLFDGQKEALIETLSGNPRVEKVVLFGSRAKGTYSAESDIDLALFGGSLTLDDLAELGTELDELPYPHRVDLVLYDRIESDALREEIARAGVEWMTLDIADKLKELGACYLTKRGHSSLTEPPPELRFATGEQSRTTELSPRSEWVAATFENDVVLQTGHPFRSTEYCDETQGIKLLRGDNIAQGTLRWDGAKTWSSHNVEGLESFFLEVGDVVLAMDRPWIESGLKYATISRFDLPALLVQRVARIRGKKCLSNKYLRYLVGSTEFTDHILSVQTGTAIPHISGSDILKFTYRRPPHAVQEAIADILSALDDKIQLNRRMAATLEEMARAIFKSWFIDFDPVRAKSEGRPTHLPPELDALFPDSFEGSELGPIPSGWHVGAIAELATVGGGSTPRTKNPEFWDGEFAWATPKDLSKLSHPVLLETERSITEAGLKSISSDLYPPGTVLMSSRAPIGYLAITEIPVAVNQGFIALQPSVEGGNLFLLRWLEFNMAAIHGRANGSTFMEISKSAFRSIETVLPSNETVEAFGKLIAPMHRRLVQAIRESVSLASVRDALLPKLISGEITVGGG